MGIGRVTIWVLGDIDLLTKSPGPFKYPFLPLLCWKVFSHWNSFSRRRRILGRGGVFRVLGFRLQEGLGLGLTQNPYFEACRVVRLISNCM